MPINSLLSSTPHQRGTSDASGQSHIAGTLWIVFPLLVEHNAVQVAATAQAKAGRHAQGHFAYAGVDAPLAGCCVNTSTIWKAQAQIKSIGFLFNIYCCLESFLMNVVHFSKFINAKLYRYRFWKES